MTKEAFVAKWHNELSGLLLRAFKIAEVGEGNLFPARYGNFMLTTIKSAEELLERMYADKVPAPVPAKPLTADEIVANFMAAYGTLPVDQHKVITAKLRMALNPEPAKAGTK